jgi:hypothetical protein
MKQVSNKVKEYGNALPGIIPMGFELFILLIITRKLSNNNN